MWCVKMTTTDNSRQWIRACSLVVADDSGNGLDLANLRITFSTHKGDNETPNGAEFKIYNLAENTLSRIRREFTRIVLQAGYQGNIGVIFDGNIESTRAGSDNGVDTWLEITAADADRAYNFSTVNKTLAAGSTPKERIDVCQQAFAGKGAGKIGYLPEFVQQTLPRGKVMYGMARKFMRDEAISNNCSWNFQNGALQMVPEKSYLPGEAVVLTFETGLIGTPEQTNDGIEVQCLLNPNLRVGGRIKLDNKSILEAKKDSKDNSKTPPALDADGFYRILSVEYTGDTRGTDWYAKLVCVGIDDTGGETLDTAKNHG